MKHDFYLFPAGLPGQALVLLRASISLFLVATPTGRIALTAWPALVLDVLALAVLIGFRTRVSAVLAGAVAVGLVVTEGGFPPLSSFAYAVDAVILAMAGPGAYSLDARFFGRRTLHF